MNRPGSPDDLMAEKPGTVSPAETKKVVCTVTIEMTTHDPSIVGKNDPWHWNQPARNMLENAIQAGLGTNADPRFTYEVQGYIGSQTEEEIERERPMTLKDVTDRAREDIEERFYDLAREEGDLIGSEVVERLRDDGADHEVADSAVPIYNHELVEVCADNSDILFGEDEDGLAGENPSPLKVIQCNIYSACMEAINERLETLATKLDEDREADGE